MSRPRLHRARIGDSLVFFLAGAVYANFAVRVPAVKETLGITDGELSIAFVGLNAGAILGLQLGGSVVPRLGSRAALRIALPLFALLVAGPGLAYDLPTLAASLFLLACLNSVVDVAMNSHGVVVQSGYGRPIMSGLHAMQPIGLVAGSAVGALAAFLEVPPPLHLGLVGVLVAAAGVVVTNLLLPSRVDVDDSTSSKSSRVLADAVRGWSPEIALIGLLAFCCTLADGAALEWTAVYLRDTLGLAPGIAGLGFTAFASAMALGRLTGDRLTTRCGPARVFRWGVLVGGVGFGGSLLMSDPTAGFFGLALLGIGLSYALPLAISAGGNLPGQSPAVAAARVSTLAYLGSFTGPAVIGFLADRIGLAAALGVPAVVVALTAVGARAVAPAADVRNAFGE